jgi:integrase
VKLDALNTPALQSLYNKLGEEREGKPGLSAKTVKNVHGIIHKALQQAVNIGYIRFNPADSCILPRVVKKEIKPLDNDAIGLFMEAISGHKYENLFLVTLFTGLREGEVLGLTWDNINFDKGTLTVNKQLQKTVGQKDSYNLVPTKNSKSRVITPANYVMKILQQQRLKQAEWKLKAGNLWTAGSYVFTDELGMFLKPHTVYHNFKRIVANIGYPEARFHDLRHSYAVAALQSGDDIKTVQENLGHHAAAFTLDIYGHVTERMKRDSADRMERFINEVKASGKGKSKGK